MQADLRPDDQLVGRGNAGSFAVGIHSDQDAPQTLEDDLVDEAAAVPTVIDDQGLLVELRVELPDELLHAQAAHIGQVDIGDLAAGGLVDDLAVVIDPGLLAQGQLIFHRLHGHIAALAVGAADQPPSAASLRPALPTNRL